MTKLEVTTGLDIIKELDSMTGFEFPIHTIGIKLEARFDSIVTVTVEYYACFDKKKKPLFKKYELKLKE